MAADGRQEAAARAVNHYPSSSAAARPQGTDSWLAAPPFYPRGSLPAARQSSLLRATPARLPQSLTQAPPRNRQVAGSNHGFAMATPAPVTACPLLEPDVTCGNGQNGLFPKRNGDATCVLHTKLLLKVDDPYGGCPIWLFPKVAATHMDKVLFLLCSRDGAVSTKCYVYSSQKQKDIVELPANVLPETFSPQSMGILNSMNGKIYSYQVAHLWLKADTSGRLVGSLYRWWYVADDKWIHKCVPVALPLGNRRKWHTHRVISLDVIGLLWIDLKRGLLRLRVGSEDIFDFVALPDDLPRIPNNTQRNMRTEACRSVGSCDRMLKLVSLNHSNFGSNIMEVNIWILTEVNTYDHKGKWMCTWEKVNTIKLLLPLANSVLCFPILSNDNSSILYLMMASENKNKDGWLLQVDTLKGVAVYPGYFGHMKPFFPINLNLLCPAE